MVNAVNERGFAGTTVELVIGRAGIPRRCFYKHFAGLENCFVAILDEGARAIIGVVKDTLEREDLWRDRVRTALASLLTFLDMEPVLARVWLVESLAASPGVLEARERNVAGLRRVILSCSPVREAGATNIPPLAQEGAFAAVLGLVGQQLLTRNPEPLIEHFGALMGLAIAPYIDRTQITQEIKRSEDLAQAIKATYGCRVGSNPESLQSALKVPSVLSNPNAHRARACVLFLAQHPCSHNRQIATEIGVSHEGQISTLLARLTGAGLVAKRAQGAGHPTTWQLTAAGQQASRAFTTAPSETVANARRALHTVRQCMRQV